MMTSMGGGGEAHAIEEKDTDKVLASPTFHFANSRRQWWWDLLGAATRVW
jgi:hypothetical protein